MFLKQKLLLNLILVLSLNCFAQAPSFTDQIKKLPNDLRKEFITDQVKELYKKDSVFARKEINNALTSFKDEKLIYATLLLQNANHNTRIKNYSTAIKESLRSLEIFDSIKNFDESTRSITQIVRIYNSMNLSNEAIDLLFKRLKKAEGNAEQECILLERIGVTFKESKNEAKGLIYLKQAEEKLSLIRSPRPNLNYTRLSIDKNLGVLYRNLKDYDKALYHFNKAYAFAESIDNNGFKGIVLNSLGVLYREKKEYVKAIKAFEESIKYKREDLNEAGVSTTLANIGRLYLEINDSKKAEESFLKSYDLAIKIHEKKCILDVCSALYQFYKKAQKQAKAYFYLEQAYSVQDSLFSLSASEASSKLEAMYDSEKKQKEIEISKIKNLQLEKDIQSKNREQNMLLFGAVILIVFLIFSVRSYIGKKRANSLLEEKNKLINNQKHMVEVKQKEVLDSIQYAKRIQTALMTSEKYIDRTLNELQDKKN